MADSSQADWFPVVDRVSDVVFRNVPHAVCFAQDERVVVLSMLGHGLVGIAFLLISFLIFVRLKRILLLICPYPSQRIANIFTVRLIHILFASTLCMSGVGHLLVVTGLFFELHWIEAIWLLLTSLVSLAVVSVIGFIIGAKWLNDQ